MFERNPMTTSTLSPITTWQADPVHSGADFAVRHMVVSTFRGSFKRVDGQLDLSGEQPRIAGSVDVGEIQVKDENLYAHLQSPEFFDSERHPQLRFESASVERGADGALAIEGNLTIKGITHRVNVSGQWTEVEADVTGAPRIGIDLETTIDRTAYGLNWNAPLPKGGFALANDVTLSVHLEFVPAEA
jgi:polyisoprenoid-binding protein YceI